MHQCTSTLGEEAARFAELDLQEDLLQIDEKIAQIEVASAEARVARAQSHRNFIDAQKDLALGGLLNKELYYALAWTHQDLVYRNMRSAVKKAFEAEQRFAFDRGFAEAPGIITADVLKATGVQSTIESPSEFTDKLDQLEDLFEKGERVFLNIENFSLQERYPVAFEIFCQTGLLDFNVSVYDVDRQNAGHANIRLRGVDVVVDAPIPAEGVSGQLIHSGVFLVRDLEATKTATRLVPTREDFERAAAEVAKGRRVTIEGLTMMNAGEDARPLLGPKFEDEPTLEPGMHRVLEGYGVTGTWRLQILPANNPDLPLESVTDVVLHFFCTAEEFSEALGVKVRRLVTEFEHERLQEAGDDALDRVVSFSMNGRFPAEFVNLENGAASFEIGGGEVSGGSVGSLLKAVILQVVDKNLEGIPGIGVQVVKHETSFRREMMTVGDGFSEDVSGDVFLIPKVERVPVGGTWSVQLSDTTTFNRIGDIRRFFMYELSPAS